MLTAFPHVTFSIVMRKYLTVSYVCLCRSPRELAGCLINLTCPGPRIVLDTEHRLHKYICIDCTDEHKESRGGHSTYSTL